MQYTDNMIAKLVANNKETKRSKSIDIKYNFVKEHIRNGEIKLTHIPGQENLADIFMKPLGKIKFTENREKLGIRCLKGSVGIFKVCVGISRGPNIRFYRSRTKKSGDIPRRTI